MDEQSYFHSIIKIQYYQFLFKVKSNIVMLTLFYFFM